MNSSLIRPLMWLCASTLAACGGSGSDTISSAQNGSLSIALMDRPVDNVTELHITISEIWLKPQGDGPAFELPMTMSPLTVNLLELNDGNAAVLVDNASVPIGSYNWLEMKVEDEDIMLSYAMTDTGGMEPVRVPSDRVRLVSGFDIDADFGPVRFLFDWDVRAGLTDPVGQPGFILRPAFRVLDAVEAGAVGGIIAATTVTTESSCADDDADLDVGNVVYIFEGAGVLPDEIDDVDGADPEPLTSVEALPNAMGDYEYRAVLMPGEYTVAATCEGANDSDGLDGNIDFLGAIDVTIEPAVETTGVDF